jgi:hypothetical protein
MITVNGKNYVLKDSAEDTGLYEHFYYKDKDIKVYNIIKDG